MHLEDYYTQTTERVSFSRQQGSDFAKKIAGDFNPIHDIDNKRFCVPGDLLFALALNKFGLSKKMRFTFSGMVSDGINLNFGDTNSSILIIKDDNDKEYLSVERSGDISHDATLISQLTESYVAFSGQTFPHILVPLMRDNSVMINPARPMVIYESMAININHLDITRATLELSKASLEVNGKRGNARLEFNLSSDGKVIGTGEKNMVLSGLRAFDEQEINQLAEEYAARKETYQK